MESNPKILEIIVCPICKGKLHYDRKNRELICKFDKLAYLIKDVSLKGDGHMRRSAVPIMLPNQARKCGVDDFEL